jgi:hypothetical protein
MLTNGHSIRVVLREDHDNHHEDRNPSVNARSSVIPMALQKRYQTPVSRLA